MKKQIIGLTLAIALFLGPLNTGISRAAPPADPPLQEESATPFQLALKNAINERSAAGLPVPSSVTYDYQVDTDQDLEMKTADSTAPIRTVKITAKTIVHFDGPEQAGYEKWPALVVKDNRPPDAQGTVLEGDYTETYRKAMEEKFPEICVLFNHMVGTCVWALPGIWEQYEFGHEPRKHTIEETFEITYPEESLLALGSMSVAETKSIEEQILMGFTYTGPHIDYSIGDKLEVLGFTVYDFKAGFELDWALGLRLPAEASLTGPDQMVQGSSYSLSSALTPLDWSGTQYANVGVAAEDGNEFVLRLNFFLGVKAVILEIDVCPSCYVEVNVDKSTSFTTPFGTGAYFPIPPVYIPIYEWDLGFASFGVGLQVDPNLGSSKITANWQASGDASGSGSITFSQPGTPVTFGPVNACNLGLTNQAQIRLTEFRYWFNQFLIELSGTVEFRLHPIEPFFDGKTWSDSIPIAEFDLSPLTGGLWLGAHTQCTWDFNCQAVGPDNSVDLSVLVVDQNPPTTSIALSGTAGNNGWYVSDVQVNLTATDNPAGCGVGVEKTEYSFDGAGWNMYTAPFTISDEGTTTVYYRSNDNEDNVEPTKTQTIKIDKTPPTITGAATTPPNSYGWYDTDVVVHFTASDAVSGIDTVTPDQILSSEGANQSVTGTATDKAGNSASITVSGINIDKTSPDIVITSPQAKAYDNTETFNVVWMVTDNLSGVATENGLLDGDAVTNGQLIELLLLTPGAHTVTVEATDKADNAASTSVTFSVVTDINGLLAATERMCDLGWINKQGICNGLEAKLNAAKAAIERGQLNAAKNQLNAFINQLEAQKGKAVNQQAYEVLRACAVYLIEHLQ
ncbi:MAG: hypothetical protein E3J21_05915 [Anaerolineales bacterium]|nr:MAG: hypothetical protein E3J21_05915 [Anaerolineales bacterium]